jgi:hypothetical protein
VSFRDLIEVWEAQDVMYLQELIEEQRRRTGAPAALEG